MATLQASLEIGSSSGKLDLRDCVMRYELRSAMSELFELTIEIALDKANFDARDLVGQPAVFTLADQPFLQRVEGIARRTRQLRAESTGTSRYEIVVVPPLWLATRRRDHRIFQDKSVVDIVGEVLKGYGDRVPQPTNNASNHPKREYTVQYGESDFDFICRILADEGIGFYFDHDQKLGGSAAAATSPSSRFTLIDDTTAFAPELSTSIGFHPPGSSLEATKPHVQRVLVSSGIETSKVTVRDYDFERPAFLLEAESKASDPLYKSENDLEAYTYEVGQFTSADGKDRALHFVEEGRRGRDTFEIDASFALAPGTRFTIVDHPADHANGVMLVTALRTRVGIGQGDKAFVTNLFETMPAAEFYRPARRPKPRIHGTQTAFVVGKKVGEDEIDVDNYGRVKVHFTWDRRAESFEGKPTRYIRVSQGWAGQGYGFVMLPRVGDELVVAYLDGDPDEPIVVGRVHNAVYTSPLNLPNSDDVTVSMWKSKSSPADKNSTEDKYNLVRMQDKAGSEMLELRAQKDFHHETLHDYAAEVGHNQTIQVKGGQSTSAGSISMSSGSTISMDAKTTITEKAGTDMTLEAGANQTLKAKSNTLITAGTQIKAESVTILINGTSVTSVHGGTNLYLYGGSHAHLGGGVDVEINGGSEVTINAPTINVKGGTVNIGDGAEVNINGGVVNLNC